MAIKHVILSHLCLSADWLRSEQYSNLKKTLGGKTDLDAALGRLDKLTQEEAVMAAAQALKATNAVDKRVRDDRVTGAVKESSANQPNPDEVAQHSRQGSVPVQGRVPT